MLGRRGVSVIVCFLAAPVVLAIIAAIVSAGRIDGECIGHGGDELVIGRAGSSSRSLHIGPCYWILQLASAVTSLSNENVYVAERWMSQSNAKDDEKQTGTSRCARFMLIKDTPESSQEQSS